MKKIIINHSLTEKRYAVLNGSKIEKVNIYQPQHESLVGHIYLGTVAKVMPGLNAVFVDIGTEKQGFLHRDQLAAYRNASGAFSDRKNKSVTAFTYQGEKLLVQVVKDETGDKGPRLSGLIELNGEHLVYLANENSVSVSKKLNDDNERKAWFNFGMKQRIGNEGFIFRTAVEGQEPDDILAEIKVLRKQYQELAQLAQHRKKTGLYHQRNHFLEQIKTECTSLNAGEIWVDDLMLKQELERLATPDRSVLFYQGKENIFSSYHIEQELDKALQRKVELANGAYLVIDETEALTIIDVNTGKFIGKTKREETVLKTNLAAAVEVAKQLRLRDIGGIILIDFIDMKSENERHMVERAIETELAKDEKPTKVLGFTELGILQLTRKKTKQALSEALSINCPTCNGSGKVLSPETIAFRLERELWEHRHLDNDAVWVETTEEVRSVFAGVKDIHLQRFQELLGFRIILTVAEADKPFYRVRQYGLIDELIEKIKQ
ncbi:Rne/Rng family ribonuclease [Bacillus sp. DNRA2]|uniref:Rne/Rng family ribonuclease n=1 Tax=Bacillus sp. DNRA2 TaxID=2723053 RepID=UPI00145F3CB2|nr:Rne/Rng family ribonuclease [Bacillus sp. DNRA2]NMD70555.1 Rne/Rng family ribonuclease [Bacillus sp. DNRA2]